MIKEILYNIFRAEIGYLKADWWILVLAITTASFIKVYVGHGRLKKWMRRKRKLPIVGSIFFGTFTPLCSCGTMAVVISMFVTSLPWGPVMAFLISSPLTSPSQFIFQSGILGIRLAIAILVSSIFLGIVAGYIATFLERETSLLNNQYKNNIKSSCNQTEKKKRERRIGDKKHYNYNTKIKEFITDIYEVGIKKILLYFMLFVAIGQIIEMFIPEGIIIHLFSPGKIYSIPLAGLVGLPLYISGSASLPLVKLFLNIGAAEGAILTFLLTGQATSLAVIAGISTFLRKRAVALYVIFIFSGSIFCGFIYQLILQVI